MSRRRHRQAQQQNQSAFKSFDYEQIVRDVARMQMATQHIPAAVREEIQKGWKQLPNTDAARSPKSWVFDPLSLQYSLGYKDRRFNLTYDTLKRIAGTLSIIAGIINTRSAQVAAFAQPYRLTKSLGFVIKHKDVDHPTTPAEVAFIKELELFVMNCGRAEQNPWSRVPRDDFETFLRKLVRDSLQFDQTTFEVVPDRMRIPYEFIAVDASTIRIASDDRYTGVNSSWHQREGFVPGMPARWAQLYDGREYGMTNAAGDQVEYVQVINGQIENIYSRREMAFGVRNPRTDIYVQGYGYGELEQLITIVTSHLNAESYNSKFFSQGSTPKGLLNLKGDNWTPEQLELFQRQWGAMAAGIENAWRTPVLQSEGIEWVDLAKTNMEMEFGKWMEYLIKIACGVFLIDPAELNFDMHGGVQQTPLFESSQEWKLKASRDRGLKPLLKFIAKLINKHIIDQIDDHFTLEFVGLDELSEQEKHEMLVEQIASYMTLNEARRTLDLPDLPGGDIPMNPTFIQALSAQGLAQGPAPGGGGGAPAGGKPPGGKALEGQKPQGQLAAGGGGPKYSDHFGHDSGSSSGSKEGS
jgi:hypothetical protein